MQSKGRWFLPHSGINLPSWKTHIWSAMEKVAGTYSALPEQYRQIKVLDASGKFVIPGTCDIHVHASQAPFQGIGQNIENGQWNTWFERYAFPDEFRFNDPAYAELTYTRFAKSLLATPTTRLCAYATTSRTATETLMKALAKFGFAGYVGKVNMDRNCAAGLLETTEETIAQTRLWLEETKDGIGAIYPILTPRYFPSCTESCLEQLGELAEEYHVPVQSHLSEGLDEIDWVHELAPDLDYYAQAYDRAGLLGPHTRAVMAHCVFPPRRGENAEKTQCAGSTLPTVEYEQLRLRSTNHGISRCWNCSRTGHGCRRRQYPEYVPNDL